MLTNQLLNSVCTKRICENSDISYSIIYSFCIYIMLCKYLTGTYLWSFNAMLLLIIIITSYHFTLHYITPGIHTCFSVTYSNEFIRTTCFSLSLCKSIIDTAIHCVVYFTLCAVAVSSHEKVKTGEKHKRVKRK